MSYYNNPSTSKTFKYFFVFVIIAIVLALPTVFMYNQQGTETVTIYSIKEQQHVSGNDNGFSTTYYYYVSTDKGMYRIEPDGIFHSNSFGGLKEGSTYYIETRGISIPFFGVYPFIMNAKEI